MKYSKLIGSLVCLCGLALSVPACAATSRVGPPAPQTFAELLASGANDLVVSGTILTSADTLRGYAGGCGFTNTVDMPVTDITLRVTQNVYGVAEDSVIAATILDRDYGPLVGREVLVWLHRTCEDAWRLRGYMGVIEDGYVTHGHGRPVFLAPNGHWEHVPIDQLLHPATARLAHSTALYSNVQTIALGRVTSTDPWTASGATYHVVPLGWVSGAGDSIPTTIDFPCQARCYPGIFPGDSLLIPLTPGYQHGRLSLAVCPSSLRVKNGFCPGLGVTLGNLGQSFLTIGKTQWLRSTLKRGQ